MRLTQGNLPAAHELLYRALTWIIRNRTLPDFPETLDVLAQLSLTEGNLNQSARLLGASDGLLRRMEWCATRCSGRNTNDAGRRPAPL